LEHVLADLIVEKRFDMK